MKIATSKKVVRILERKRFWQFECGIFPPLANWRKTEARREPRRDYNDPLIAKPSRKTDTALRKCSARSERQIFTTLEKIDMFASKLQHSLRQKHFDPAIRPILHQFIGSCRRQPFQHFATRLVIDR